MNKKILRGKWRQTQGELKTEWGRLTHNDRRVLDGKFDQMVGMLQERYGYSQEWASSVLENYLGHYRHKRTPFLTKMRNSRYAIISVMGMVALALVGWFTFTRLLSGDRLHETTSEEQVIDSSSEQFEEELSAYAAALD